MIRLAYPVVFSSLAATLMGLTDTLCMGWVNTAAQAGVGLGATLSWACASFFVGTLTVINTFTAQHFGAKQEDRCGPVAWHGALIALVCSAPLVIAAFHVRRLVGVFGAEPAVADAAASYTFVRVLALPFALFEACLTSFLRGIGDTRTPMKVSFVAVALNVPLDIWLIFGGLGVPALGARGAAIATVAAQAFSMFALAAVFWRAEMRRRYHTGWPRRLEPRQIAALLRIGIPIGVGWVLEMAGWTIFTAAISGFGKAALAAHNIVLQMLHVSFMPGLAISVAATTLVGQHLGAEDPQGAEQTGKAALRLAMGYMAFMSLVFLFLGSTIASGFSRDPQVVELAGRLFLFAATFQIFDAMGMVSSGILRGAGDTRWPMVASVTMAWLVFLPLSWLGGFYLGWGVVGGWAGATVYIIALGVVFLRRVRAGGWKSLRVVGAQPEPTRSAPAILVDQAVLSEDPPA